MADRAAVERAFRQAQALADAVRSQLDGALGLMRQGVWKSPAADGFTGELIGQRQALFRALDGAVDELRTLLASLPDDPVGSGR